jgi:hypothetical protein
MAMEKIMNQKIFKKLATRAALLVTCVAAAGGCNDLGESYKYDIEIVGHVVDQNLQKVTGRKFKFCLDYQSDRSASGQAASQPRTSCAHDLVEVVDGEFKTSVPVEFCYNCLFEAPEGYLKGGYASGKNVPGKLDVPSSDSIQSIGEKREGTLVFDFTVEYVEKPAIAESFSAVEVVTHESDVFQDVDLLWVVDNSGSMEEYQTKVAKGLVSVARNFFQQARELRMSVIGTDAYLATSPDYPDALGACYARLVPGSNDGPSRPVLGFNDPMECALVDPLPQKHTGKPILSSRDSSGQNIDPDDLAKDFAVNAQVGLEGTGDERALQSVDTFLTVNEERDVCRTSGKGCLFRKNTLRGIIFLADEHSSDILSYGGEVIDHRFDATKSMSKSEFKRQGEALADLMRRRLNAFFRVVDGSGENGDPNYFVASIVNKKCVSSCDSWTNARWSPEYMALAGAVKADTANRSGPLSMSADIHAKNYSELLTGIGKSLNVTYEYLPITTFKVAEKILKITGATLVLADGTMMDVPLQNVRFDETTIEIDESVLPAPLPRDVQLQVSYVPY